MNWVRALTAVVMLLVCGAGTAAPDLTWLEDDVALHNFVAGVVAGQISEREAVGVTVSIVRGGRVLLAQGFGLADRAQALPVIASDTLFRIGSVSKLFVWVGVMQQVEAGKLNLDADVNIYLSDLEIPQVYPEPITLRHLMTHTAGFEDRLLGLFAQGPRTVGDFHDNLRSMLPRRVMMPGRHAAYSNYGAALAAHIVEAVSGEPWDDYVQRHILNPLGMSSTTTRQPVGDAYEPRMARGYWREGDRYEVVPFEFVTLPPAGSISATATDMARFMGELLAEADTAVLGAAARAQLFDAGFSHDARLSAMRNGPYEMNSHGRTLVGHDGVTLAFHSRLLLDRALDVGIFVSCNSDRSAACDTLITAILDRLFGAEAGVHTARGVATPERYEGFYTSLRAPVSGHDKIMSLLGTVQVSTDADGALVLRNAQGERRFVAQGDDLFAQADGAERIAFRVDGGRATYLFLDSMPMLEFARVAPRDDPRLHLGVVAAALLLCSAVFLCWPLSWWRHRGRVSLRGELRATLLAVANAALVIGYFVVLGSVGGPRELAFGLPPQFLQAMWVPVILIPMLLLQLLYGYRAWLMGWWWPARRIHYTLLVVAGFAIVAWAFYWHLTTFIVDW